MIVSVLDRCFQVLSLLFKNEIKGHTDLKVVCMGLLSVWELYPKDNDRKVRMLRGAANHMRENNQGPY